MPIDEIQKDDDSKEDNKNINISNINIENEEIPEEKDDMEKVEEEVLFINYDNIEKNNQYEYPKVKPSKNNNHLYIQMSAIDDQITDRKVDMNDNEPEKKIISRENSKPYFKKKIDANKNSGNSKKI